MTTVILPQLLTNPFTLYFLVEKTRNGYCGKKRIKDATDFSLKKKRFRKNGTNELIYNTEVESRM